MNEYMISIEARRNIVCCLIADHCSAKGNKPREVHREAAQSQNERQAGKRAQRGKLSVRDHLLLFLHFIPKHSEGNK